MQQPSNLRRCGEMFIKFDANGQPQYGFTYDAYRRTLTKYYNLQESTQLLDTVSPAKRIELPVWDLPKSPVKVDNPTMLAALATYTAPNPDHFVHIDAENTLQNYAQGGVRIAPGCFKGLPNLQLVVPGDYSVMLDESCFDDDAQVELVTSPAMTLKQIVCTFDTGYDYARESWTLLSHRDFNYANEGSRKSYFVRDFRASDARCQFTLSPAPKLSTCAVTPVYANLKLHANHRPTLQDYRAIAPADDGKTL